MTEKIGFTIITVCLNSEKTIRRTLDSVLRQTCRDYEYLVLDGGSRDRTVAILEEYVSRFADKGVGFHWQSGRDDGIYDAMNKGITRARGTIIGIINSDDYYEEEALETVKYASQQAPEAAVYYGLLRVIFKGRELNIQRFNYDAFLLDLETGIHTSGQHPSCFVRKSAYDRIGGFDTQFKIAADYDLLIRVAKERLAFFPIDAVLANFSRGGASDKMKDYSRFQQRYGIWLKNNLITEEEYKKLMKQTKYTYLKELKVKLVSRIFSYT